VLDREKAAMGVLFSLQPPMHDMAAEIVGVDSYEHKTIHELTHCTTGIYVLFAPPGIHRPRAPSRNQ
jgi:hypothetical protein